MRNINNKHIGLEIDKRLHFKFKYICEYDGRSINKELIFLIRRYVEEFENKHGVIKYEDVSKNDSSNIANR
jgi:regulatory protein